MSTEEATINPDGSSSYESASPPPLNDTTGFDGSDEGFDIPPVEEIVKGGIDPAIYLVLAFATLCALYYFFVYRKKEEEEAEDEFFSNLDGDKVRVCR